MLPDRVSNPGPLTYKSGALQIALRNVRIISEETSPASMHEHPLITDTVTNLRYITITLNINFIYTS